MSRLPLSGLIVTLGLLSAAWMPTGQWQPVPGELMPEITAFFASMDQDRLNRDVTGVLSHYTPDITLRIETPDGRLLGILAEPWVRDNITRTLTHDQAQQGDLAGPQRREDFQYQPGPDSDQFAIRYNERDLQPDSSVSAGPYLDVACVFVRGRMGLRIALKITRTIMPASTGEQPAPPQSGQHVIAIKTVTTTSTIPPTDK